MSTKEEDNDKESKEPDYDEDQLEEEQEEETRELEKETTDQAFEVTYSLYCCRELYIAQDRIYY
jgi:hypothetical protein